MIGRCYKKLISRTPIPIFFALASVSFATYQNMALFFYP
jgi:hypothetical protein